MGEHLVSAESDEQRSRDFMRALLADVWAIDRMLETGQIESGIRRIGAEQELFLIDRNMRPAPIAKEVLQALNNASFTTELAKFNLEANLTPRIFEGDCLRKTESELEEWIGLVRKAAASFDCDVVLCGILPTFRMGDLSLENMTDVPRYFELNRMLSMLRGSKFYVHIKGLDEVHITHDNMMLEACNTSFQVHIQVDPKDFVDQYNVAQAISGPVMAVAVNSPLLFGQRLWAETRLALLQHSVDDRSQALHARFRMPRVSFGERWIERSILDIFRQDIAQFRVILTHAIDEDPIKVLERGEAPRLSALRLHNGTIWRWNRPCYGILDGKAHLRIENRLLPSGPTIPDEVANAAFFLGLMCSVREEYGPVDRILEFDHAKANFYAAARHGLNAQFQWFGGATCAATDLILHQLLPLARHGLKKNNIATEDIDRYLGAIEERVRTGQTGAQWMLKSLSSLPERGAPEMRLCALTSAILSRQKAGGLVHDWSLPNSQELGDCGNNYSLVGQIMTTNLFTCRPDDIVDYVASLMHWERIRHVPVEDLEGRLVGLLSIRNLLPLLAQGSALNRVPGVPVHTIMKRNVITVTPETRTRDAIEIMRKNRIGCLPVVKEERLVGILTLFDLLTVSAKLLETVLSNNTDSSKSTAN